MRETEPPDILLVDKPEGPTSHDVVHVARKTLGMRRIGHTGTLDPFASGLLILCVGTATRLVEYFHLLAKTYAATALLGLETDTEDRTGRVTRRSDAWRSLNAPDVARAAGELVGNLEQVPPAFSAVKHGGKRSYEVAREGGTPVLAPREVEVHSIDITRVDLPEVDFRVSVSTGTYVRSLARDLGRSLGCGAHLDRLRREAIGPFSVEEAASLAELESGSLPSASRLAAARALDWLPQRRLSSSESESIRHGRPIPAAGEQEADLPVALLEGGRLLAIGRQESEMLKPDKVFPND